jgi:hypothetical protein
VEALDLRSEMSEGEESRRAAAFSKRVSGRKKSTMTTLEKKKVRQHHEREALKID